MNYPVILLILLPMVYGAKFHSLTAEMQRSISSRVVEAIEDIKLQMPCGFDKYGIPALAPFHTDHENISIESEAVQAYGEVRNFSLFGLNDFDIVELKINLILSRANFKFNWNNVYFNTNYSVSARSGRGLKLTRSGPAEFALKNVTVWGLLKYSLGVISGNLQVKELKVYVSLDEVTSEIDGLSKIPIINKKLNRIIEEWFMISVNENTNKLAEFTNNNLVPLMNEKLRDKSLSDILAIIVGGGNNENEPCIPSQYQN